MALKAPTPKEPLKQDSPVPDSPVVLEMNLFTNYTIGKVTYKKGEAYRFAAAVAQRLLRELHCGVAVWKLWRPKPVVKKRDEITDATDNGLPEEIEPIHGTKIDDPNHRIDIGDDSEIADLLDNDPDAVVV